MTKDPLCPQQPRDDGTTLIGSGGGLIYCECDLIAKVRADEREEARQRVLDAEEHYVNIKGVKTSVIQRSVAAMAAEGATE